MRKKKGFTGTKENHRQQHWADGMYVDDVEGAKKSDGRRRRKQRLRNTKPVKRVSEVLRRQQQWLALTGMAHEDGEKKKIKNGEKRGKLNINKKHPASSKRWRHCVCRRTFFSVLRRRVIKTKLGDFTKEHWGPATASHGWPTSREPERQRPSLRNTTPAKARSLLRMETQRRAARQTHRTPRLWTTSAGQSGGKEQWDGFSPFVNTR